MQAFSFASVFESISFANKNPDKLCVFFSSYKNINVIARQASDNIVLCSTAGEFTPNGYSENSITGFWIEKELADVVELDDTMIEGYHKLKKSYEKVKNNPNAVLMLFFDGLHAKEEKILENLLFIDDNFKIVGGSAGDGGEFKETFIYIGSKRVVNAGLFLNIKTSTAIIKENIYAPTEKMFLVTDSDKKARCIKSLNNMPAATAYAKALNISEENIPNYIFYHPFGRKSEGDIYTTSVFTVNPDKSISTYGQIRPFTTLYLLESKNPVEIFEQTIEKFPFKPSFIFSVNCLFRCIQFKKENLWKIYDSKMLGVTKNQTGFISYGEQYYKKHVNQTATMLLVQ